MVLDSDVFSGPSVKEPLRHIEVAFGARGINRRPTTIVPGANRPCRAVIPEVLAHIKLSRERGFVHGRAQDPLSSFGGSGLAQVAVWIKAVQPKPCPGIHV